MVHFVHAPESARALTGHWALDPLRSFVEFHVPHLYGLVTVKGRFTRYDGALDLRGAVPTAALTVYAASVETQRAKRDEHLRSDDFFYAERHPEISFASDEATFDGARLTLSGELHAAGRHTRISAAGSLLERDGELEVDVTADVDQRALGMTWSPLGLVRTPSRLVVRGRLVRQDG
jgi:polyisoprenoid-binding protein YceI